MGLDMYLRKKTYIFACYEHCNVKGTIELTAGSENKKIPIDLKKVEEIVERAGYWRKANAVHGWFVQNVQDGEDDCGDYYVPYEKLQELKKACLAEIEGKGDGSLEPVSGFFFGSTEKDQYYIEDLKQTVEIIDSLDPDGSYYYHSSW